MAKYKRKWRELGRNERKQYATAMRRLHLGTMGYRLSTLRQIHLTTREGDDNSQKVFAKHLRKLVGEFRDEGYDVEYNADKRWIFPGEQADVGR